MKKGKLDFLRKIPLYTGQYEEYQKDYRLSRKAVGFCFWCNQPRHKNDAYFCKKHRDLQADYQRQRTVKNKKLGSACHVEEKHQRLIRNIVKSIDKTIFSGVESTEKLCGVEHR